MSPDQSILDTLLQENRHLQQQITELRQSQQLLQLVLDSLPLAIAWKDPDLVYQGCNRQFAQEVGLETAADIVGKTDLDLREPVQAEQQRAADQQVLASGTAVYHHEELHDHTDAPPTWLRVSRIPIYNGGETPSTVLGVYDDITSYKQELLRLTVFKDLIDTTPDAIAISGMDGILTYLNSASKNLFKYDLTKDKVTLQDMIAPWELERLPAILEETHQKGFFEGIVHYQRADGSTFPAAATGFFMRDIYGNPEGMAAIIRDISEQVRREHDLRTFYALVENAPDGVGIASLDGFTIYANPAYQAMLGIENMIGMVFTDYVAPQDHALIPTIVEHVQTTGTWQGQLTYRRTNGETFLTDLSAFIAHDEHGQPLAMVGIIRDLTEQMRAEEERAAQQATLRALSTPLIPLADDLVVMPLIGSIDSARAQQILEALLQGVADYGAATVIIDITGVEVVDTEVANGLVRAAQAVKLLGAQVILTGIRPEIAQTLVGMGADLTGITTQNTLQSGVRFALKQLMGQTTPRKPAQAHTSLAHNSHGT